jgi:hypothetical protein
VYLELRAHVARENAQGRLRQRGVLVEDVLPKVQVETLAGREPRQASHVKYN